MDEEETEDFGVESVPALNYLDCWACRFLAMSSQKERDACTFIDEKIAAGLVLGLDVTLH